MQSASANVHLSIMAILTLSASQSVLSTAIALWTRHVVISSAMILVPEFVAETLSAT